jgi:hypothetical protein
MNLDRTTINTVVGGLALVAAGALIGRGFSQGRSSDRFVTVKGVSEQRARADLALWPLRLVVAGNDLPGAYARLSGQVRLVRAFLARNSIDTSQLEVQNLSVTDANANQERTEQARGSRYVVRQTLMVRSTSPEKVLAASQRVGDLVEAGIALTSGEEYGSGGPTFVFTGLNAIKPRMIAEATARARDAATQFANDSRSQLGGIRQADQGVFEILPRDQAPGITEGSQIEKTIRVVSRVEYFLRN